MCRVLNLPCVPECLSACVTPTCTSPLFTTCATPHHRTATLDSRNGECGRRSRSWFVYVAPGAASLSHNLPPVPPVPFTLISFYCVLFPKSRHLRRRLERSPSLRRGRVFVGVHRFFCRVFSQVAARGRANLHSSVLNI